MNRFSSEVSFVRLVSMGGPGIACSAEGITLGPAYLVTQMHDNGRSQYSIGTPEQVAEAFLLAFGASSPDVVASRFQALERIAGCLNRGELPRAMILALLMRLPEIPKARMATLRDALNLKKYNPNQPRISAGDPHGGRWTDETHAPDTEAPGAYQTAQAVMPLPLDVPFLPEAIPLPEEIVPPPIYPLQPQNPHPEDPDCVEEWEAAARFCSDLRDRGKLGPRSGFGADYNKCLLGYVSERCGGNPVA